MVSFPSKSTPLSICTTSSSMYSSPEKRQEDGVHSGGGVEAHVAPMACIPYAAAHTQKTVVLVRMIAPTMKNSEARPVPNQGRVGAGVACSVTKEKLRRASPPTRDERPAPLPAPTQPFYAGLRGHVGLIAERCLECGRETEDLD